MLFHELMVNVVGVAHMPFVCAHKWMHRMCRASRVSCTPRVQPGLKPEDLEKPLEPKSVPHRTMYVLSLLTKDETNSH